VPTNDIIDNRKQILADRINRILSTTEMARFAVGYFFVSGFTSIAYKLKEVKELRLLIGNTTNQETIEQLAEARHRLELVKDIAEEQAYPKRTQIKEIAENTAQNIRSAIEYMDQTDEGEMLVNEMVRMIEEKRLKVKVYTKGRLHAKAYIFNYGPVYDGGGKQLERHEEGIAIVGSSNLTLAGVTHNTELNVVVQGNNNHAALLQWFDELWDEAEDFDESLMNEMSQSWAGVPVKPYDIYMKTLYALVKDRLEGEDDQEILFDSEITRQLADFQKTAVRQVTQIIRDYGGAFVSDVVGLGKSYIGAAIIKQFERIERARPLIICPATLVEMWERYNEVYELNARVLSMGYLYEREESASSFLLDDHRFKDRDFVLIDESHNFRYPDTQRYKIVQSFLSTGKRCCFLTATPRNKSAWDVFYQIKLFHQDDTTDLPIDPPDINQYFKLVEKDERRLPDLLSHILIRRTRNHILKWYGFDAETNQPVDPAKFSEYLNGQRKAYVLVGGKRQFFPKRELETIEYSIEDTYEGLYQELRGYLGKPGKGQPVNPKTDELTYARYGLWHYVLKSKQRSEPYASLHRAGINLRGLIKVLLFKRFESSVYAFRESIRKLITVHERFKSALLQGLVPAGDEAQEILYEPNDAEEQALMDELRKATGRYDIRDFDVERLLEHIEHDISLLKKILSLVEPITPDKDDKLQVLIKRLNEAPLKDGKRLIFTQYADTARYIYENLNPSGKAEDIEVIYSGDKSKAKVVGRFAPKANTEYQFLNGEKELMTLVATDVLAEGLNLQDCDKIINYDLHWNPVRLIQRFGRIDRIGSDYDVIYAYNFLPEAGIERNLGLKQKLRNRIQEIHDTIGEDCAILDHSERLNEEAMYAIYEKKGLQLGLFDDEEGGVLDISEAEELMRQLKKENPVEYERIASLRDGIRSAKPSTTKGTYVFCQAGKYQQLFLVDDNGETITRDIPRILSTIKCSPDTERRPLPKDYNAGVMRVKKLFAEEVRCRESERQFSASLTHGQRYVVREMRILFNNTEDADIKAQINILEAAFRKSLTRVLKKELNRLRINGVSGQALLKNLSELYHQHNMRDWLDKRNLEAEERPMPIIICSENLV
jgi:superfamily II DNA or RNA helicase